MIAHTPMPELRKVRQENQVEGQTGYICLPLNNDDNSKCVNIFEKLITKLCLLKYEAYI